MRVRSIMLVAIAISALGTAIVTRPAAYGLQLITKQEAALPAARVGHDRGISRGPTIEFVSPSPEAGTLHSPIELKIKFVAHGGAKIDTESVLVTYMKQPMVDLTQRLKPFIAANGIDVEDAEVPRGTHWLRVNVSDNDGHTGEADFTFTVSR